MGGDELDPSWREHAELWDADLMARAVADGAVISLREILDLSEPRWRDARAVDLGCGTGLLTERLSPWLGSIVAVDHDEAMLEVLRRKSLSNVSVHRADIEDPAMIDASWLSKVDLAVASCVCGTLTDYETTVAHLGRSLKPGGLVVQWDWLLDEDDEDDDGLTLRAMIRAYRRAGLTSLHVGYAFDTDDGPIAMGVAARLSTAC